MTRKVTFFNSNQTKDLKSVDKGILPAFEAAKRVHLNKEFPTDGM